MFVAMMVDYGIVGLIVYLVVIIRLILIARRADRNLSGTILVFCCMARYFQLRLAQSAGQCGDYSVDGVRTGPCIPNSIFKTSRGELIDDFAGR